MPEPLDPFAGLLLLCVEFLPVGFYVLQGCTDRSYVYSNPWLGYYFSRARTAVVLVRPQGTLVSAAASALAIAFP